MFALTLTPIYFAPTLSVRVVFVAPLIVVALYLIWLLFACTVTALEEAKASKLPSLLSVHHQGDEDVVFLLETSRLYGQGMRVSVYHEEESGYEIFVASGRVRNIQDNGLIQVILTQWDERHAPLIERLKKQERLAMEQIMVKPSATTDDEVADFTSFLARIPELREDLEFQGINFA